MENVEAELTFLLRSDTRRTVLVALDVEGVLCRDEIEESLDASRRTVSRVLKTLVDEGYVRNRGNRYRLTAYGAFAIDLYRDWRDQVELTEKYRPFLAHVDDDLLDVDVRLLQGADLTVSTDVTPYAALDRYLGLQNDSQRIRVVTPIIEEGCLKNLERRLQNGDPFELEVIIPKAVIEQTRTKHREDPVFETIREAASISRFVYPGSIETMISVVDDVATFGAYADRELHALLESDAPELYDRATERIDAYRHDAVPIEEFPA
jgi:predicted transcriptional regulator